MLALAFPSNSKQGTIMSTTNLDEQLDEQYAHLIKTTEGSNKFYNIYIRKCIKGAAGAGTEGVRASQNGYEVYSFFGRLPASSSCRQRHLGFYFSQEAANRSAKRLERSKLQKGYIDNGALTRIKGELQDKRLETEEEDYVPLFDPIPESKSELTETQINRFSSLLD